MSAQQKMSRKIASRSTQSLRELAASLYSDIRDEASIVLSAVLDELMGRLPEADFVDFCAKLEAA